MGGFVGETEMTDVVPVITGSSYVNKMGGITPSDSVTAAATLANLVTAGVKIADWVTAEATFADSVRADDSVIRILDLEVEELGTLLNSFSLSINFLYVCSPDSWENYCLSITVLIW